MSFYFICLGVFQSSSPASSESFLTREQFAITWGSGKFYMLSDATEKAPQAVYVRYMNFSCKNWWIYLHLRSKHFTQNIRELPAATCKFNWVYWKFYRYFYMRNSCKFSQNFHAKLPAIARNKAHKLRVTSPAGFRIFFLHFAGEIAHGVIAKEPSIVGILPTIEGNFASDCNFFACNCKYSCLQITCLFLQKQSILHANRGRICISSECQNTCNWRFPAWWTCH